jgi:hypothetical protein
MYIHTPGLAVSLVPSVEQRKSNAEELIDPLQMASMIVVYRFLHVEQVYIHGHLVVHCHELCQRLLLMHSIRICLLQYGQMCFSHSRLYTAYYIALSHVERKNA